MQVLYRQADKVNLSCCRIYVNIIKIQQQHLQTDMSLLHFMQVFKNIAQNTGKFPFIQGSSQIFPESDKTRNVADQLE